MDLENKQEVVERVNALMDVAETLLRQRVGTLDRAEVLSSRLYASVVGSLITSDPVLYDLLEEEEEDN